MPWRKLRFAWDGRNKSCRRYAVAARSLIFLYKLASQTDPIDLLPGQVIVGFQHYRPPSPSSSPLAYLEPFADVSARPSEQQKHAFVSEACRVIDIGGSAGQFWSHVLRVRCCQTEFVVGDKGQ